MPKLTSQFFICDASDTELRGFNLIFRQLYYERELEDSTVFKTLSGLRVTPNTLEKVKKNAVKHWLRDWHKRGWISLLRCGRFIRMGNIHLFEDYLDPANRELIRKG